MKQQRIHDGPVKNSNKSPRLLNEYPAAEKEPSQIEKRRNQQNGRVKLDERSCIALAADASDQTTVEQDAERQCPPVEKEILSTGTLT